MQIINIKYNSNVLCIDMECINSTFFYIKEVKNVGKYTKKLLRITSYISKRDY
jgi:hypothetical protein